MNEPLGPLEKGIFSEAEKQKQRLIITWIICRISILCFKNCSDEKEFVRVYYLNDIDKVKNPVKKQARENVKNTGEWKQTLDCMKDASVRAESFWKHLRKKKAND